MFSIYLSNLEATENFNMLCNDHGGHLPNEEEGADLSNERSWGTGSYYTYDWRYEGKKTSYTVTEDKKYAGPAQAYVLAEMNAAISSYGHPNNYNKIQSAWYIITGTHHGNYSGINSQGLDTEANAYAQFIEKISTGETEEVSHTFDNGKTATVTFPKVDKKKVISQEDTEEKVTVKFNTETQKYVIGPIKLKYAQGTANGKRFGGISGMRIYTDKSSEPVANSKWNIIRGKEDLQDDQYPDSGEKFYIEMDYIEGATKLTKIDLDYEYLIVGAHYSVFSGSCFNYAWRRQQENGVWDGDKYGLVYIRDGMYKYSDAQQLVFADDAARWYETTTISLTPEYNYKGDLQITKKALDENGNEMTADQIKEKFGDYLYFDFKVTITHHDGEEEIITVPVRAGSTTNVGTYTWEKQGEEPKFDVVELLPEGWKQISLEPSSGKLQENQTVTVTAVNQQETINKATMKLNKTITGAADHDETFEFNVHVDGFDDEKVTIIVPQGQTTGQEWSKEYVWYENTSPEYHIEELPTEDSKKYQSVITPSSGKLEDGKTTEGVIEVNATNHKEHEGYVVIEKDLVDGQVSDQEFTFKVTVEGTVHGTEEQIFTIKPGQSYGPIGFVWKGDTAPKCTIEEMNGEVDSIQLNQEAMDAGWTINGNKSTGPLIEKSKANVQAKFVNKLEEHKGKIHVTKEIETEEKLSPDTIAAENKTKFEIKVEVKGTFEYKGKKHQNETEQIKMTLPDGNNWDFTTDDIIWWGDEAPTFTISEDNLPLGWQLKGINCENAGTPTTDEPLSFKLLPDKTAEATVINKLPSKTVYDLTFAMAGIVWIDNSDGDKDNSDEGYHATSNGVYDPEDGDILKEGAEVNVYRVVKDASGNEISREIAKAYSDANNTELAFPVFSKADGEWNVPRIGVPAFTEAEKEKGYLENNYSVDYDVEFIYDGQTYEPAEFLSYRIEKDGTINKNEGTVEEKAERYRKAKTKKKDEYARDSMAIETSNNTSKITKVSGKTAINANGDTVGIATLEDGSEVEISYSSDNAGEGYPTISKLNTTDSNGEILDIFKATATTSAGNLMFPLPQDGYDGLAIDQEDHYVDENGVHHKYSYFAVYNHCLHINLGLKKKPDLDVGLTKNLKNAKVVVNQKMYQYNYSGYYDLTETKQETLDKDIIVENSNDNLDSNLGLYKTDYYYRAAMYRETDETLYDNLQNFYKNATGGKDLSDTEMDIYLTYEIKLQNNSSIYDVKVDSIDDYYDSSFTLVREDETKYLNTQTINNEEKEINQLTTVAEPSDYADKWNVVQTGIVGSDHLEVPITYNKMTADNLGIELHSGGNKTITMTFKINKEDGADPSTKVMNSLKLGYKCNVAEIASYASYKVGTTDSAGKIDRDSAPANVNISAFNDKTWYEDDTFAAARINVNLINGANRTIKGTVWEDDASENNIEEPGYNQTVGNGKKDGDEEKGIEGLTTELIEKKVYQEPGGQYIEADFTWPTAIELECLGNQTLENLTSFKSEITTENDKGEYAFEGVPAGNYVVRFTYGDKKIESKADYSKADYYNGQDYKSSKFNAVLKDGATTLCADSYLDIDAVNRLDGIQNAAVDSEVRRLEVAANSREIMYENNEIMAMAAKDNKLLEDYTLEEIEERRGKLINNDETSYNMYAETPKLDINLEMSNYQSDQDETKEYTVNNINFGLEERPITQLSLDNQIEEIILTTSDGNNIMDAKYKIEYHVDDEGIIKADVTLDKANSYGIDNLQALNRDEATNQGFRYVNVDSTILEGTTLTVKYRLTVLNTGEVDRTGQLLADLSYQVKDENNVKQDKNCIDKSVELSNAMKQEYKIENGKLVNDRKIGEYLGSIYYYGEDKKVSGESDAVVTSTVRQLVDYVDNDAVFDGTLNATTDMSWSNVTADELGEMVKGSIFESDGTIIDAKGILYETENRNNLAVSVDNEDKTKSLNNNGFIVELVPQNAVQNGYNKPAQASMNLITTRYVGADSDDLQVDNIAEIIKYNNKVGRRDEMTIVGNKDPGVELQTKILPFGSIPTPISDTLVYERDTSATEVVTLSPPTGTGLMTWRLQVIGTVTAGLALLAGGIVLIKKRVLK